MLSGKLEVNFTVISPRFWHYNGIICHVKETDVCGKLAATKQETSTSLEKSQTHMYN